MRVLLKDPQQWLQDHLNEFKHSTGKKRMTSFPSSQGGGPGRSQPPAVTRRKSGKQPRIWGLWERRPRGFYGNGRRRWPSAGLAGDGAAELRTQEAGEMPGPALQRGAGAMASAGLVEQVRVCHSRAPMPGSPGGRGGGGRAAATHPRPFLASPLGAAETSGAQRRQTSPRRQSTLFLPR